VHSKIRIWDRIVPQQEKAESLREMAIVDRDSAVEPMTPSASMFTFRKNEIGLHCSVWCNPSSGTEEEIFGFVSEQAAKDWIANKSPRWLRDRQAMKQEAEARRVTAEQMPSISSGPDLGGGMVGAALMRRPARVMKASVGLGVGCSPMRARDCGNGRLRGQ
jgi:hypothetical protein